jgi:hypothetical protein
MPSQDFKIIIECENGLLQYDMQGEPSQIINGLMACMLHKEEFYGVLVSAVVCYAIKQGIDLNRVVAEAKVQMNRSVIITPDFLKIHRG